MTTDRSLLELLEADGVPEDPTILDRLFGNGGAVLIVRGGARPYRGPRGTSEMEEEAWTNLFEQRPLAREDEGR